MQLLKHIWPARWYAAVMLVLFGGFAWATFTGYKLSSDDNDVKNIDRLQRKNHGHSHYYHK